MFKPFHSRSGADWVGEAPENQFFMRGRHGRKGSFGGGWGEAPRTRRGDIKFMLLGLLAEQPQHSEQADRTRDLLVQVKREIYKLLAEQ